MIKEIKRCLKVMFRIFGYEIIKLSPMSVLPSRPFWDNQNEFNLLYGQICQHTVVSKNRLFMLYQLLRYASNLDGDIAEVGVYRGGTAKLIAKTAPHKNVHLFDTFFGIPAICIEADIHTQGDFGDVSLRSVKLFLNDCPNITFYQGVFADTAESVKDKKFSFVHIDVDIYKSIRDCLEFFYERMVTGGVMVIDDYESLACPGVKKAVSEFLADKKEYPIITTEIQCAIIKL